MKTGLFFGTFNPIHNGHIAIAEYMANKTDLDEVWLVVSPQNPLKGEENLLGDETRLNLVKKAIDKRKRISVIDVEFHLPKPSYTIHTLHCLVHKYPEVEFVLIIGEDNLRNFQHWKNHEQILEQFELYVYPRVVLENETETSTGITHPRIKRFNVELLNISATAIRKLIKAGHDVTRYLPRPVHEEIREKKYYR